MHLKSLASSLRPLRRTIHTLIKMPVTVIAAKPAEAEAQSNFRFIGMYIHTFAPLTLIILASKISGVSLQCS